MQVEVKIDPGKLPLMTNEKGEKVLRMYWLDAYEEPYKQSGSIWLFGKVFIESAKTYISCCVSVKNIERQVFFLKRDNKFDLRKNQEIQGSEVNIGNVYEEFSEKIAAKFKISEFKSKPVCDEIKLESKYS